MYTLNFIAKTYIYGPIPSGSSPGIIKKVQVDYHTDSSEYSPRSVRYIATASATKNYAGGLVTTLISNIDAYETILKLADASSLSIGLKIYLNEEIIKIKNITGNNITAIRGYNDTKSSSHISGETVYLIDVNDDELISLEDDFGFNGSSSLYSDSKIYNPVSGTDIDSNLIQWYGW